MTATPSVLVSDLDGTLLGNDLALSAWRDWYEGARDRWRVVYASGRSFASIDRLVRSGVLPAPAAVIADVGSAIHDVDGRVWPGWPASTEGWTPATVLDVGRAAGLTLQDDVHQRPWKVSFEVPEASVESVARIDALRDGLRVAAIDAEIIVSGGRFVDVLPAGVGKGAACRFLVEAWSIPLDRVIAAGDSGNDLDLLRAGVRAIVVANAEPELDGLCGPRIYRAGSGYAAGVLEGIRHWTGLASTGSGRDDGMGVVDAVVEPTR